MTIMVANRQEASGDTAPAGAAGEDATGTAPPAAEAAGQARVRALRKFGLVVGGVFAALALLLALRHRFHFSFVAFTSAATLLLGLGLAAPARLDPIERVWMKFGSVMGWINTRVLLTTVFFVVLTPVSLILRLVGRDPLKRRFDRSAATYWEGRSAEGAGGDDHGRGESVADRYKRQY